MLNEASLEGRLRLVEKEIASLGDALRDLGRHLMAEVEAQRSEIEALKHFLAQAVPGFTERYSSARASSIQENRPGPDEPSAGVPADPATPRTEPWRR